MEQQTAAPVTSSPAPRGAKWWLGMVLLVAGITLGTVGLLLTLTIVLAPVGLPVLLAGLGLAVPGAMLARIRRSEPIQR